MEDRFYCKFCDEEYDLEEKLPRVIKDCGHCICLECLKGHIKRGISLVCPIDSKVIQIKDFSINNFPENVSLMQIISYRMNQNNSNVNEEENSQSEPY